jgi:glucosamine-6-phosphate deaminase
MRTIPFQIFENPESGCAQVAAEISQLVRDRAALGRTVSLGLATCESLLPLYEELIYLHREEGLSLRNVITFHLSEYLGLGSDHPMTFRSFMQRNFFDHVDIPAENIHFPSLPLSGKKQAKANSPYELAILKAGGIDLQILGVSINGNIAFNQSCSPIDSKTRWVALHEVAREELASSFGGLAKVPTKAITMGCSMIFKARRIAMLAWGTRKARIVRKAVIGNVSPLIGASYLQTHPSARFILDAQSGSLLRRKSPTP